MLMFKKWKPLFSREFYDKYDDVVVSSSDYDRTNDSDDDLTKVPNDEHSQSKSKETQKQDSKIQIKLDSFLRNNFL